jgi:hypothetical protein
MPRLNRQRVAHKSTGGIPHPIPPPVDPVGNALTSYTVALPGQGEVLEEALITLAMLGWWRSGRTS